MRKICQADVLATSPQDYGSPEPPEPMPSLGPWRGVSGTHPTPQLSMTFHLEILVPPDGEGEEEGGGGGRRGEEGGGGGEGGRGGPYSHR